MFENYYLGKKVVVTGHTGFKGTWLCNWLLSLGANVSGISDRVLDDPSLFGLTNLETRLDHHICDVTNSEELTVLLESLKPDVIFHLAAQAIVSTSYQDPLGTIMSNSYGTACVCEFLRKTALNVNCVFITSDKCYENVEWEFGYRENDELGGKDIYSASKACAEILFKSYFESFLVHKKNVKVCSARAGNVIGGGDWSKDRIVVDMINSWMKGVPVQIRSPDATRPWQHVLEPLSGYLHLGATLEKRDNLNGQSFNFGPKSEQNKTVIDLSNAIFSRLAGHVSTSSAYEVVDNKPFHEAGLLKLCCDKALMHLGWEGNLSYVECVDFIGDWYVDYISGENMELATTNQIQKYGALALDKELIWTVQATNH